MIFTPEQKKEATQWIEKECPNLYNLMSEENVNLFVDMYLKLKAVTFDLKPEEFVVGVEYKVREDVIEGKEAINIRFLNPRRAGVADAFAQQLLIELLTRLKS